MALENAQWIDELVIANPTAIDVIGEGDDHLRLLKVVLTNTFIGDIGAGDIWDSTGAALLKGPAYLSALSAALDGTTPGDFVINGKGTFNTLDVLVGPSTFAGEIQLENAQALTGRDFADTKDTTLIQIDASDQILVGEAGSELVMLGVVNAPTGMRLPNTINITGRNFANDANVNLIEIDANDDVVLGQVGFDSIIHGPEVTIPAGNLTVNGDLTYTGTLFGAVIIPTLANTVPLQSRNAANNGDLALIKASATDDIEVGQIGNDTVLLGDVARSVSPFEVPAYTTANLPDPSTFNEGALAFDTDVDELKVVALGIWKSVSLGVGGPGSLMFDPVIKTAAFNVVDGVFYIIDTTASSFIMTLPAAPAIGARVGYIDYARQFATNNAVWTSAAENIETSATDYEMDLNAISGVLRYVDVTQGWLDTGGMA